MGNKDTYGVYSHIPHKKKPVRTSTVFAWSISAFGMAGHGLVFYIQVPEIYERN